MGWKFLFTTNDTTQLKNWNKILNPCGTAADSTRQGKTSKKRLRNNNIKRFASLHFCLVLGFFLSSNEIEKKGRICMGSNVFDLDWNCRMHWITNCNHFIDLETYLIYSMELWFGRIFIHFDSWMNYNVHTLVLSTALLSSSIRVFVAPSTLPSPCTYLFVYQWLVADVKRNFTLHWWWWILSVLRIQNDAHY